MAHTIIAFYRLFTRWIRQNIPEDLQNVELFSHVLTPTVSAHARGAKPSCGNHLRVRWDQRSSELGSSAATDSHQLLHWVLGPARREAPHEDGEPDSKLHAPGEPAARHHLLSHRHRSARLRHGESHVCQSVHSGRWAMGVYVQEKLLDLVNEDQFPVR